jgi:hypothetical protein
LLHQHVGNAGLALAGQGVGQHFVIEVAHGVQLTAAHGVTGAEYVTGLAHLLEDLLQKHRLELLGDDFQLLPPRRGRAVGAIAQCVEVLG